LPIVQNISKEANRINSFESNSIVRTDLGVKLADVLGINRLMVERLIKQEHG
jgi:hypothetical protein